MKKYAIATDDSNSDETYKALEHAGFNVVRGVWSGIRFLTINVRSDKMVGWAREIDFLNQENCQLLSPSYVIANASELDGAKRVWEVAPEGYRLVTDEERKLTPPSGMEYKNIGRRGYEWSSVCHEAYLCWNDSDVVFAVPIDFTFTPKVLKLTMADLEAEYGCKVEIERGNS